MDVDHEKLLSGDVNFKWQRDFTAFTAVREEFLVHPVGAVKDYDSPYDAFIDIFDVDIMKEIVIETNRYAHQIMINNRCRTRKASNRLLPVTNQLLTVRKKKNNNEESVDDCDERAEAGRGRVKSRGQMHRRKIQRWHDTSNVEALTVWARFTCKNIPEDVKEMKKNCERGTIIARHSGDVMVLAWKDAKIVSMISTFHDNITYTGTRAGEECEKPICVKDYNTTMGGIDLKDQTLSMYPMERKRV
ncbi:PiggyBac transposable element-derived protein 4 [Eumeta japonica]|uniref:PiggyBac transposable element-derived protein 4 n=1 Tax=Eumeta variegata TaxID=151549 RepID=A0A4C1UT72_EUMVA|nr:PiggyBac transposable element-derived protein 4 [Eumeta japonica]